MDRRFLTFFVVSIAIWMGFLGLRLFLVPDAPAVDPAAEVQEDPASKPGDDQPSEEKPPVDKDPAVEDSAAPPAAGEAPADQPAGDGPVPSAAEDPNFPRQRVTLGSVDPNSPYSMLVTFDTKGAVVERVELSSNRYRDIEDYSGYLGHLDFEIIEEVGLKVNVVGPGTPAALAKESGGKTGIEVGDIITAVGDKPTLTPEIFDAVMAATKPGEKIQVKVLRPAKSPADSETKPVAKAAGTSLTFDVNLTRKPLQVVRPESHTYEQRDGTVTVLGQDPLSLQLTLENLGGTTIRSDENEIRNLPSLISGNWQIAESKDPNVIEFHYPLSKATLEKIKKPGPLTVVKRFTITPAPKDLAPGKDKPYSLGMTIELRNESDAEQQLAYRLDGPTGLPLEGWWYSNKLHPDMWAAAGARDVAWKQTELTHHLIGCPKIHSDAKAAEKNKQILESPLLLENKPSAIDYIGVDTQFFASMILPGNSYKIKGGNEPAKNESSVTPAIIFRRASAMPVQAWEPIPKTRIKTMNVSSRLVSQVETIAPGETLVHNYRVFFGPKEPDVLKDYGMTSLIEYGWSYAAIPAFILRSVLETIYSIIPNYGIAIILLTVIVRSAMIPVSLKQAKSAAMMQQLAPEMAKIKEKYADNMEKQSQAIRELYAKHNFNPFGGCLPVFIQLPVFIGLYRCLSVDIELRDAALFPGIAWASNLAGPDKLFYWKDYVFSMMGDEANGWLGPFFNVFPLITVSLFLVQQKMFTPPATDEQTAMQQKMMTYMTVFMGVMFYKVPAGLCVYFITSSLWGIAERKLLPKPKPVDASAAAVISSSTKTDEDAKSNGKKNKDKRKNPLK